MRGGDNALARTSEEGQELMKEKLMTTYLIQLNNYALEQKLISEDIYKKIELSILTRKGNAHK